MKILIPVVVGAIIGYFTNWLAIKMLFRPNYEKRFLGIKIPFTPGLIPKERKRIAESIGQAVGRYLLSPDTIIDSLSNQGVGKKIQGWIGNKIDCLRANHKPLKEVLDNTWNDYTGVLSTIKGTIGSFILSQIRKEQAIGEIVSLLNKKIDSISADKIYDIVERQLEIMINDLSNSNELRERLGSKIRENLRNLSQDERTLGEILPAEIQGSLDKYIDENGELIGQSIRRILKDHSIKNKIKNSISSLITENINTVFFVFISPDFIADKILSAIERYIDNEEANEDIIFILKNLLNRLMETKISDLLLGAMDVIGEEGISQIEDVIIQALSNPKYKNILSQIIRKNLEAREEENKERILNYLDKNLRIILNSEEMEGAIFRFVDNFIVEILDKPISSIVMKLDNANLDKTYDFVKFVFNRFLERELPQIVEFFNIERIVEERINSFEVDFFEDIIIEIAERELKAITWLGGLLGGILGLLSPLLQMIY